MRSERKDKTCPKFTIVRRIAEEKEAVEQYGSADSGASLTTSLVRPSKATTKLLRVTSSKNLAMNWFLNL